MALSQDIQKTIKKTARREQLMREEAEQKRLKTVLELQFILEKLGDDEVRSDLKQGSNGVPVLTEEELTMLDEFYKLVYPERDMNMRLNEQYEQASVHLWDLLEGKEKPVCGTTCKYSLCMKRQHIEFVPELKRTSDVRELGQLIISEFLE